MRKQGKPPVEEGKKALLLDKYKKEYLLVWDVIDEEDNQSYEAIKVINPTEQSIKELLIDYYNLKCQQEIITGMVFEEHPVWLSQENQLNYQAAWDFAKDAEEMTPLKIKLGTDFQPIYRTFTTKADLQIFISAVHYHIQNTLEKYWEIKDSINWDEYVL